MKKVFLLLILTAGLASCEKASPCESLSTGTLCIENTLNEPLKIYINGDYYRSIQPGAEQCVDGVPSGTVSITAVGAISNKNYLRSERLANCSTRKVKY